MALEHAANTRIDFHGIPIDLAYEPFEGDAFSSLFASFSRTMESASPLHVDIEATSTPCAQAVDADWRPTFCHGLTQGYSRDGAHILSDGKSRLEVFPRLGRISGRLFESHRSEVSSGMQHIALSLLLRERGVFDVHAATACTADRALIVLGDSGAGKTTTLLSLMALGCEFLGDDRLLLRALPHDLELLAYPREFHVTSTTLRFFPELTDRIGRAPRIDGKHALEPIGFWPKQFRRSWRGAISLLLPRVDPTATTTIRPVNAAEAFGKLLSSSASVAVDGIERTHEQLQALHALADASNAYELSLGADLLTDPRETARRILDAVESKARVP